MRSTPAHKQTDPAKSPGQIVNPINHDMMDDMALYAFMNRPKPGTVGEYARRKADVQSYGGPDVVGLNVPWPGVTAEEKQALLDADAFKPGRDLPCSYDPI